MLALKIPQWYKLETCVVDLPANRLITFWKHTSVHAALNKSKILKTFKDPFHDTYFLLVFRISRSHVVFRLCAVTKFPTLLRAKMQCCIVGRAEIHGFAIFWTCILGSLPCPAQCYPWMSQAEVGTKTCWGTISFEY